MRFSSAIALLLLGTVQARLSQKDLPQKQADKAYGSQADACTVCNHYAQKSQGMGAFCKCFAANSAVFGATSGGFDIKSSDQDNWHFACSVTPSIGENYMPCP